MQEKSCVFMGAIPTGALFFMRLENAFLLSNKGDIIEIISQYDNLENDLIAWCRFKGENFQKKFSLKNNNSTYFAYILQKQSPTKFTKFNPNSTLSPIHQGLAPNGSSIELASPKYHFPLNNKNEIWGNNLEQIYEESKKMQWNATTDILWSEIPSLDSTLEFATAQIMTYLTENEFSALYIPSRFLAQISPFFTPIPLVLSSIIGDEGRHIESFVKRANATGLGVQYSTLTTQQSLYSLWNEKDYFKSSFLLHVMGEGTFIDLLRFLEKCFENLGDLQTAKLLNLARRDETRHVAYGMNHIKSTISQNPSKIAILKDAVFKRKNYLESQSDESSLLLESMAILAGGSETKISSGFESVLELKKKMEKNRTKRLMECGIDEDLARDLSRSHTPNFM